MQLDRLNGKYYGLFEELCKARRFLTDKQFDVMAKVLQQQYMEELDITLTERILEVGISNFELKFRSKVYIPRRGFFGYNKIAKRLLKQYKAEFLTELKKLELDVKEEKDFHMELDAEIQKPSETQSTALTVAQTQTVAQAKERSDETDG
ncbi:MAG: hypothetical protein NC099_01980 [Corallococcus sp.]|nr:hypothetical protein [Corallococcus sp.]